MTQRTSTPRPLRRDAELNRQRIMAAAREVFAQRGLDATLDDIAHHAGLGVGTVYRRFPNKTALVDALFEETFHQLLDLVEEAGRAADAWAGLRGLIVQLCEMQVQDRGLREVMLSSAEGRSKSDRMRDMFKPTIDGLVERAKTEGPLRSDFDPHDFPMVLLMVTSAAEYGQYGGPDVWRRYLTMFFDGLCERRDKPTPLPAPAMCDDEIEQAMQNWPPTRRS
ncbi:MAG TPA: TetR/AcrR family transcriptional regulator [Actinocrinis sp.]|jgi:AcrR family transcriptional regulator|uniref:TetR/AcrR family transcriptional regulator n=1 Tax=Actinocrinis sp. TaxID=1920516 RepID=UPI002DDCD2BE|nr:TetR/AcrR family transcriptional regulator [Actinocrinis sp.]HEV3170244.1 TetR/AcrR family transcriptional regulator [Actinocrinis sp.]